MSENFAEKCNQMHKIVSGRKNVTQPFIGRKYRSTSAAKELQCTAAHMFERSCYVVSI